MKNYVENRQQDDKYRNRRRALGDQHRVTVPMTRLDQAPFMSVDQASNFHPATYKQELPRRRETYGFDTDGESLENSTIGTFQPGLNLFQAGHDSTREVGARSQMTNKTSRHHPENSGQDTLNASKCDEKGSSESESSKNSAKHVSSFGLMTGNKNEESVILKRQNVSMKSLFQHILDPSREHSSELYAPDLPQAPVNDTKMIIPMSSRSSRPTHTHAAPTLGSKSRDDSRNLVSINNSCNGHDIEDSPTSLKIQDSLGDLSTAFPFPNRMSHLRSPDGPIALGDTCNTTESPPVPGRLAVAKPPFQQVDHDFDGESLLCSDLSDHDGREGRMKSVHAQGPTKRKLSLDYSLDDLNQMNFQALLDVAFDNSPAPNASLQILGTAKPSIGGILEQMSSDEHLQAHRSQRHSFFDRLTLEQYIESGEIIARKLDEAIRKLSLVRQEKREVVKKFEKEIVEREATISSKATSLRKKMGVMTRQTEEITAERTAHTSTQV